MSVIVNYQMLLLILLIRKKFLILEIKIDIEKC